MTLLTIKELGHQGDGIAFDENDHKFIIPYALPDEEVLLEENSQKDSASRYTIKEIIKKSPHRTDPLCSFFGECGGCQLQHMDEAFYTSFKEKTVYETLKDRSIEFKSDPLVKTSFGNRRRATLSIYKTKDAFVAGYKKRASTKIITIDQCPALHPTLQKVVPFIGEFLKPFTPYDAQLKVHITLVDQGVDLVISGASDLKEKAKDQFLRAIQEYPLICRVTWAEKTIYQSHPITVTLSGISVDFPTCAFLQPSLEGEKALIQLVLSHLPKKKIKIVELFSGLGTFTLPMAQKGHKVITFESDRRAVLSFQKATAASSCVTAHERDLYRHALTTLELNKFDCVVLDPPRTGAHEQMGSLAQSIVKTVIMVTCNLATFGRDAQILIKGGYTLKSLTPVDQFVSTAHLEAVALFVKNP
jgi:23S rRNA (uracil1939-C5)-methyltransferase